MSITSRYIREKRMRATQNNDEFSNYKLLLKNLDNSKNICETLNQDFPILVTGSEGSGKSTIAILVAAYLDADFSFSENMIYTFDAGPHSMTEFARKYLTTPYKAPVYDEAVSILFSQSHNSKQSKECQEWFKLKRECKHFDILVIPSYWDMVKDIRERRAKAMIYTYLEKIKAGSHISIKHRFAYFTGEALTDLSESPVAQKRFRTPQKLFKTVRPSFTGEFPGLPAEMEKEYRSMKWDNLRAFVSEKFEKSGKNNDAIMENNLDFRSIDEMLKSDTEAI